MEACTWFRSSSQTCTSLWVIMYQLLSGNFIENGFILSSGDSITNKTVVGPPRMSYNRTLDCNVLMPNLPNVMTDYVTNNNY